MNTRCPSKNEDLRGKLCVCNKKIIGLVNRKRNDTWIGKTLEGKNWSSRCPKVLVGNISIPGTSMSFT